MVQGADLKQASELIYGRRCVGPWIFYYEYPFWMPSDILLDKADPWHHMPIVNHSSRVTALWQTETEAAASAYT
jgi:hypothetical protein